MFGWEDIQTFDFLRVIESRHLHLVYIQSSIGNQETEGNFVKSSVELLLAGGFWVSLFDCDGEKPIGVESTIRQWRAVVLILNLAIKLKRSMF